MQIANKRVCTGCMACVDSCSKGALTPGIDLNGYYEIRFDSSRCIGCGLCTKTCPIITSSIKNIDKSNAYAVWSKNKELREQSASGGAFSTLAYLILQEGGVVYGAGIVGFEVRHRRVDSLEDLPLILGSKYQHSVTEGIFKLVYKDLKAGLIVLFCGMACQIAGLKNFLRNINTDNLYTIDTICGGLSTILPMLHLKQSGHYSNIVSFRDKEFGWKSKGFQYALKMRRNDGSVENLGSENLVLKSFSSKLLKRSSCLDCHFTGDNRVSDCTIGDLWGDELFKEEHYEGVSVLIVHSLRIFHLIEKSDLVYTPIKFENFICENHNYYWSHYPLISYFRSRKKVLRAMKQGNMDMALHLMHSNPIAEVWMKVYLKCNYIFRKYFMNKFLQKHTL